MPLTPGQCYFISAGEFSGDLLAAELSYAIREEFINLTPFGITGPTMRQARICSIATTDELNVMGLVEVARKACDIKLVEARVIEWVTRMNPKFAILVDFPGFHFRLAEQFKMRGIPVFQYVAPKVWAWGRGRLPALRENFTKVLGVLPFEEEFFKTNGVNYQYVGSPHWDRMSKLEIKARDLGFPVDRPIIAFLPGSRRTELARIMPELVKIRRELLHLMPEALCVVPLASSLSWDDVAEVLEYHDPVTPNAIGWEAAGFWWLPGWSLELMKISTAAVVASGTATLECALAGTPMVVVYVMNELSFHIAKRAVSIKWASLVNLLMNEEVVKEHLQYIDAKQVAHEIFELSQDSPARRRMDEKFAALTAGLKPGAAATAASVIKETLNVLG